MFERLKRWGNIEVPLTAVIVVVAITVIVLTQPQKEIHYVIMNEVSQKLQGL